jgi:hypothetical protein
MISNLDLPIVAKLFQMMKEHQITSLKVGEVVIERPHTPPPLSAIPEKEQALSEADAFAKLPLDKQDAIIYGELRGIGP